MKRVTKAGNTVVNRRLTGLAILTGMVLLFSSGICVAADLKLFHKPAAAEKYVELAHISATEKEQAVKWLKTDPSEENIVKFVTGFSAEPIKFAEGIKAALDTVEGVDAKKALIDATKEKFTKVNELLFGSSRRKLALMDILMKSGKTLEEIFDGITRDELALLTELPKEPDAKPTDVKDAEKEKDKTFLEKLAEIKDAILKGFEAKGEKPVEKPVEKPLEKPTEKPAVEVGALPGASVGSTATGAGAAPRIGEQPIGALAQMVNQVCDLKAALDANKSDASRSFDTLVNGLNDQLNQEAIRNRFNNNAKKNDGLEAAAAAIAQSLNDQGKGQNAVAAPPPPPPSQPLASNNNRRDDNQPLPIPTPEQTPPPQQPAPVAPFTLPFASDNSPVRIATGNNLPFGDATNELDRAEQLSASLEGRTPYTKQIAAFGPNVASSMLVDPIAKLDADINRANSVLRVTNDKAKSLDRDLLVAKEGGRKLLAENDLRREKQYESEFNEKKEAFDQEKQMIQQQVQQIAQSGGDAATYQQQANGYLQQKNQELSQAKKRKEQFTAELDLKAESFNGKIKQLAAQRDDLKAASADIEGKLATLKSEQTQLSTMYTTALQREMSGLNGGQVAAGAKQFGNNAQTILGYSGNGNRGAAALPGKLQRGAVPANQTAASTGTAGRGMLGSKGTPTL